MALRFKVRKSSRFYKDGKTLIQKAFKKNGQHRNARVRWRKGAGIDFRKKAIRYKGAY